MTAPELVRAAPPRRLAAPHSSTATNEDALANELVRVLRSWIEDIAPAEPKEENNGPVLLR